MSDQIPIDGKFYGQLRKYKDNSRVDMDACITFLATDNALPAALAAYYEKLHELGADRLQIDAVGRMILRVQEWRRHNADKCKVPDLQTDERTAFGYSSEVGFIDGPPVDEQAAAAVKAVADDDLFKTELKPARDGYTQLNTQDDSADNDTAINGEE